jgi:hypothetical protein
MTFDYLNVEFCKGEGAAGAGDGDADQRTTAKLELV